MPVHFGPLQAFLDDDQVNEVMVIDGQHIWVETAEGIKHIGPISQSDVALCAESISRASGRRIDLLSPIIDARLPHGARACVVIPPIAVNGTTISIRKFPHSSFPLTAFGNSECVGIIRRVLKDRLNVLVSGSTSSGKTSLVTAALQAIPHHERIVCVEDTAELRSTHPHIVRLQTRPANSEGEGLVDLQQLVRTSLRLRPDRLVVGEVRGAEAIDMLLALSSGHRGCWSTVHAHSACNAIQRLTSIVLRDAPQWSSHNVNELVHSAIDIVVHVERTHHRRHVVEILDIRDAAPITLFHEARDV
jgi:pilus assembly protein CpaF